MRVCLDTNVLVSAFATRGLCADIVNSVLAEHELVIGETVLTELRRTLTKKLKVPSETVEEIVGFLRQEAIIIQDAPALHVVMLDPGDRLVLSEAVAGAADVLVTGDRDFLDNASDATVPVVDPRGFWERLRST